MSENQQPTKRRPRVLVVDDNDDITEMLHLLLQQLEYDVVPMHSASDALSFAKSERFDLMISDIGMPGIDGYELAVQLRALPEYKHVPMIAVTGFSQYDDRDYALAAGFDEYMRKPIDLAVLTETLQRLSSMAAKQVEYE